MAGNVWEWTGSWLEPPSDLRVVRGGSFNLAAELVRSAVRDGYESNDRLRNVGFRVVIASPQKLTQPEQMTPQPVETGEPVPKPAPTQPARPKPAPAEKAAPAEQGPSAVLTIDKPFRLELIRIPAGEFLMGDDKTPSHVDEFHIGKYPVINSQYQAFVAATQHRTPKHWKKGKTPNGKDEHPVVYVSWYDAVAFCEWLSQETGHEFRLPSEEEWEKAARGGLEIPDADGRLIDNPEPGREYPWGDQAPTKDNGRCNFGMNVGGTTPVDQYPMGASPYGVLDMVGNVWEWTDSWYDKDQQRRVVRGSSYEYIARDVRCAARYWNGPHLRPKDLGFRVVVASAHRS
jgi:formylglycine-generating enzyme required for sulfatase activity